MIGSTFFEKGNLIRQKQITTLLQNQKLSTNLVLRRSQIQMPGCIRSVVSNGNHRLFYQHRCNIDQPPPYHPPATPKIRGYTTCSGQVLLQTSHISLCSPSSLRRTLVFISETGPKTPKSVVPSSGCGSTLALLLPYRIHQPSATCLLSSSPALGLHLSCTRGSRT